MIGCAREERRDEGEPKDDLRERPDFFNFKLWLDESASEWVQPSHTVFFFAGRDPKVAGAPPMEGDPNPRTGGVSLQESPPHPLLPTQRLLCAGVKKQRKRLEKHRCQLPAASLTAGVTNTMHTVRLPLFIVPEVAPQVQ